MGGSASNVDDAMVASDGDSKYIVNNTTTDVQVIQFAGSVAADAVATALKVWVTARANTSGASFRYRGASALVSEAANTQLFPLDTTYAEYERQCGSDILASLIASGAIDARLQFWLSSGVANGARATFARAEITYNRPPTAPTQTAPSGTISTLVPTFTGTHNDPDSTPDPMSAVEIEVRRVSDDALMWASGELTASGTSFSQVYAGSTLVSGTAYKWRARTKDNSGASNALGAWSGFVTFTPVINTAPTATIAAPATGAQVGTLTPTLTVNYSDPQSDTFSAYQFQVRRQSDQVSFWDPGQVATTGAQQTAKAASVTYAGTALVSGTVYEVRARVKDSPGLWSDYTAWSAFTPAAAPNPPTGLTPTGLQNTLTPTVAGVYSQGLGGTESAFQYEVRQGTTTIYQSGDVATAIATGQAYGTNNPSDTPATPPALAWGTAYQIRARSKDNAATYSDWTAWQDFNTNAAPTTPTGMAPTGGAITSDQTPTLSWVHNDPDTPPDAQTAVDVEMYDNTAAAYVTGYNPKTLAQATLTHDVTETLVNTHQYQWRIRTKGLAGPGYGPYSAWQVFTVAAVPTCTLTDPTADEVFATPAQTVTWTFSGGSGTQQDYQVKVFASDQTTVVYDSGVQSGTAVTWNIPAGTLSNGQTYYVQAIVHDTLAQLGQSSKVRVTTSWTPPATITGLSASAVGSQ